MRPSESRRGESRRAAHATYRAAVRSQRRARSVVRPPKASLVTGVVVDARVTFNEDPQQWKWRPVVVLSLQANRVVVLPCTSTIRPGPHRLAIRNWRSVGLLRPTDICLRSRTIELADLGRVRGELGASESARLIEVLGPGLDLDWAYPEGRESRVGTPWAQPRWFVEVRRGSPYRS